MPSEPPPLPEPSREPTPPVITPPPIPAAAPASRTPARRLHPLTLLFTFITIIRGYLIPALIVLVVGSSRNNNTTAYILLFFLVITLFQSLVRYFTLTYRIESGELVTRDGLIQRTERNIPLTRVQDVRIEQSVLQRIFNVVEVQVETAGGTGAEASFSVLARDEAERLRAEILAAAKPGQAEAAASAAGPGALPADETVRQLSVKELVLAGLASNQTASTMALVAVAWGFADDVFPNLHDKLMRRVEETMLRLNEQGMEATWPVYVFGALAILAASIVISIIGSIVLFYGFTLTRKGEDLQRVYGLFTRRASSLPRKRIQVLKIEETIMRRLFRLATLYADTAGSQLAEQKSAQEGRNVLLPVVLRAEVDGLLPVFFPHLDPAPAEWKQVSRVAIRRGTLKGGFACVLLAGALLLVQGWAGLWPLALIPVVYVVNVMNFRHLGYALGEHYLRTRRGWLRRATHIVPIRNIQAVALHQTPFDRRHRVVTLVVDTAGQTYTGGAPAIGNVPIDEARKLAAELTRRAAQMKYRWQ
ncbi:MAG: PH domain-containing protein [Verrucomicrobiota bacterium]